MDEHEVFLGLTRYTWAWLGWIMMFFVIEVPAIRDKRKGDTLTEHVRRWGSIGFKKKGWRARRLALLAFMAWLALHFLVDGFI